MISRLMPAVEENRFAHYSQAIEPLLPEKGGLSMQEILVRMQDEDGQTIWPATIIPCCQWKRGNLRRPTPARH